MGTPRRQPLAKQVFLVTGCGSGIGQALVGALVASGASVVATDADEAALQGAAEGWATERVLLARLDVRDAGAWEAALDIIQARWGRLDGLLNVAGVMEAGWLHEAELATIDRHLDVNVRGVILGTRAAARRMIPQGHGHIVNIASLTAIAPMPGLSVYSASKFAVRGFSLAVRQELLPHNVYVSVVCPDAVATPMLARLRPHPEAAVSFHAGPLPVQAVVHAILTHVLPHRPPEVILPRHRGWLAKVAMLAVPFAQRLTPLFIRRGRARQGHSGR